MSVELSPYLNFAGNTREALEFYQEVFGGELTVTTFGDMPGMPVPDGYQDKIMHGMLTAPDVTIMASEGPPGHTVTVGDNVNLSLFGTDTDRLTRYFTALSADGKITMALDHQPWGDVFGMLTDKFGINWLVNISQA